MRSVQPHVYEAFDCQSNGRPDSEYLKWRWKPDGCYLPRRALKTWSKWVDNNMKGGKVIFYLGYSSAHFRGGDWDSGGTCIGETEPVISGSVLSNYPLKMKIVEEVIQEMLPVVLLNITKLTNFRKDGHPSVYGNNVTDGQKVSTKRQDCSPWYLPGVPNAWNELIYATLIVRQTSTVNH
ncbi:hypothetical protein ACH5RR_006290 [Cinchona calisaya]|uniref:Trichome birefringence-like N-terminal domain-containing protein n=1 Tax=Cinchona calisaya TaxID=153742 RepID=A0ABD3ANM0_9GENT